MKLLTNKATGRIYARLKTGNPASPYLKMTLGTKNAEEARRKAKDANLSKIEAALQAGELSQQAIARLTVGKKLSTEQAAAQWIAAGRNRDESPATTAKNASVIEQWFNHTPAVRALPPMALTEAHVSAFINRSSSPLSALRSQPSGPGAATRLRQLSVLRTFLRYCADMGITRGNVAGAGRVGVQHRALSQQQREPKKIQPFTAAEVERILANTEGWWHWAVGIANATGMRLGDICQLEHTSLEVPGHIIVHLDKSDRRVCLPVNDQVTPGLAGILAEIPLSALSSQLSAPSPYLFPEAKAQYDDIASGRPKFSVYFGRELARLGIAGRSFHSLRHTAISRWHRIGFNPEQCADYAGHGSSKVTKGYIHP